MPCLSLGTSHSALLNLVLRTSPLVTDTEAALTCSPPGLASVWKIGSVPSGLGSPLPPREVSGHLHQVAALALELAIHAIFASFIFL